jgi:hypothetical protein
LPSETPGSRAIRQQVDLQVLTAELLAVVDQTMQPIQASLWLRPTCNDAFRSIDPRRSP